MRRERPQDPAWEPEDAGEPIEVLAAWRESAPAELVAGVRAAIDRRETAAAIADLSWRVLGSVIVELGQVLWGVDGALRRRDEEAEWERRSDDS